ncbi:MAG: peptide chain release factor N(5)-glutamine methyltransferase [Bosea sp. (in: a-proteobacteria)]
MFYDGISRADAASLVRKHLRRAKVGTPDIDARLLMQQATGLEQLELITRSAVPLTDKQNNTLQGLLEDRLNGTPIARLLGYRDFWGLRFTLSCHTLEPRPDSEAIIEEALDWARKQPEGPARILDLGTGTGCLLIALLTELPGATGLGTDISRGAVKTATDNATANGVAQRADFSHGSWAEGIDERFDLIVSNPPYITSADIRTLEPEVRDHDPKCALDGGPDGLDAYRAILADLPRLLHRNGLAVVEIGAGQEPDLRHLAAQHNLVVTGTRSDLGGHVRAICLQNMS